jgi:hypothetical protein
MHRRSPHGGKALFVEQKNIQPRTRQEGSRGRPSGARTDHDHIVEIPHEYLVNSISAARSYRENSACPDGGSQPRGAGKDNILHDRSAWVLDLTGLFCKN